MKRNYLMNADELAISRKKTWANYYAKNKEKLLAKNKQRRIDNPDYYKKYEKERYAKNPEFYKNKHKKYSQENREKVNEYIKNKYTTDLQFKLKCVLRSRLVSALKNNQKNGKTLDLIGCSIPELKIHIEKQFKNGMNWKNWEYKGWHIDHIKPISLFDLSKEKEVLNACHYTNLQPLWGVENHKKGNRLLTLNI